MLATLAALQLLVLAQSPAVDPYPLPPPADTAQPPGANPPLPSKPRRGEPAPAAPRPALPADTEPPPPPPPPATPPPAPQAPSQAPAQAEAAATPYRAAATATSQLSLLGAEPLSGGSAVLVEAGWSSIGAYYGQGITRTDDLGALATYDWAKTELRLGGFYRRPIGVTGAFDVAGRLSLAWYNDFGKSWVYSENHRDHGLEVAPALILSTRAATGILSITAEAPITITLRHDSGLLFSPRISVGYEVPLYDGLTLGGRAGLGYRGGSGDAPLSSSRGELTFLIVGGYRLF